uniref:Uncharacterized protein n=1 Tax=Alexandrium andersonii TaxID=327968 RepID=A0A7S2JEB3_9DINO|mmetsp:Transcript_98142/g.219906  ORF Transcript_98142/g.219906 Transcript_98142/m.219906 type:complete len:349 (+) Transcript_98142:16-1062(+)
MGGGQTGGYGTVGSPMDLICCATRSRATTAPRSSQLFANGRRFGSQCPPPEADGGSPLLNDAAPEQVAPMVAVDVVASQPAQAPEVTEPVGRSPRNQNGGMSPSAYSAHSSEDLAMHNGTKAVVFEGARDVAEDSQQSEPPSRKTLRRGNLAGSRSQTNLGLADPFLQNGETHSAEEAAAVARLEHLIPQVKSEVRVQQQSPRQTEAVNITPRQRSKSSSKASAKVIPPGAPATLYMELVPGSHGSSYEKWTSSEIVWWDSEKAAVAGRPRLASVRLLRIKKVRLDKTDSGFCMRLRTQQVDTQEVCEDYFVHKTESKAQACSEALVEAINLVRALVGKSVYAEINEY